MSDEKDDDLGVVAGINRLRSITNTIRILGFYAALCTGCAIASFSYILLTSRFSHVFPDPFLLLTISTVGSFGALVFRDSVRKGGETLFEELSDELQWHVLNDRQSLTQGIEGRPSLEMRYQLRRFARNTDLPLISGPIGTAIYALLNLSIFLAGAYLSARG